MMTQTNSPATETMNESTKAMVREWLANRGGDVEKTARWMRDDIRIAGLRVCRKLIAMAMEN